MVKKPERGSATETQRRRESSDNPQMTQNPADSKKKSVPSVKSADASSLRASASPRLKSSSLLDTRVIYCGDNLEQLGPGRTATVWGETREKRAFEDRHASTQAYIDFMRPRRVQLARVLKKTGSFYYHCDWHASHHVKVMLGIT